MNLLLCFFPMIALAIGGAIAFGFHSYFTYTKARRRKTIPVGKWYISYSNFEVM